MFKREHLTMEYATDLELKDIWGYLVAYNLVDTIFCSDKIAQFDEFTEMLVDSLVFSVRYNGDLAAMVWLNTFENKTARMHFLLLPPSRRVLIDGGREVVKRLLDWNGMHTLYGFVPEWNKGAIKYYRKLGFRDFCEMPDLAYDINRDLRGTMICSYINKEIFHG